MPRVYINNRSQFDHTNEIKMAVSADGSCDPNLQHLGDFSLESGERQHVIDVDETTEFYWKNIYELYWTHKTVWHFDDEVTIRSSTLVSGDDRVDICDSQVRTMVTAGEVPAILLEKSAFLDTTTLRMVDGFANWEYTDLFCRIARTAAVHGYAAYLPTFNVEERPDGKHYEVIAVKDSAGFMGADASKNLTDYGGGKYCPLSFCYLKCPSVQDYFRHASSVHVTSESRTAGAIPTFCFREAGEIPRSVILFTNRGPTDRLVFRAEDIGNPDPEGAPSEIIRAIVEKGKSYSHIVAAYPDFHHAYDPRPGAGKVFGVTLFYTGSADLLWLPESEIR